MNDKGGTLINGFGALIKEAPESFLAFCSYMRTQDKMAVYGPGSHLSAVLNSART